MLQVAELDRICILPRLAHETARDLPHGLAQLEPVQARIAYSLNAIQLALQLRPGIVYCGHAFMTPLALLVARMVGAQLVTHVHGLELGAPLSRGRRHALAASDLILCVSNDTAARVVEITGADPQKCRVIYNTVDGRFTPGDRAAARRKFAVSQDATVLSTVSRLDPDQRHKGHDRVIPLLKNLAVDFPGIVYLIAGTGRDRDRLEALARSAGCADLVRFLGFVADDDLPDLYRASDLYVMPSHGEGFGIAFVEAMCCGTPALGLDIGGAGDALRDGELGRAVLEQEFGLALRAALLTPPSDPLELAERARAIFGRPAFVKRLAEATAQSFSADAI